MTAESTYRSVNISDEMNASLPGSCKPCQQHIAYGEQMGWLQLTTQKSFTRPIIFFSKYSSLKSFKHYVRIL